MEPVDILLVEDDRHDADLTLRAFKKKNLQIKVRRVNDGVEALNFLSDKTSQGDDSRTTFPRLILSDLKLPRLDGIQLTKEIKSNKTLRIIPVVIFTSSSQDKDIKDCYRAGANAYVVKPLAYTQYCDLLYQVSSFWLNSNSLPRHL